ncbi:MAG: hypothetical protein ACK4SF_17675 [Algoriphagus aquaeductus]|uniref:Uncharacterized protein n=1 Tax=Algoriphagus aquaeductus TaxID=475299 RepID=A0A326S4J2_9BACT|nr:hypothetical protein [Algoriphagus aquaeductus]PZV84713.1 hypothetical protein CLV31_104369 [Algoriphagus aquaeductus]
MANYLFQEAQRIRRFWIWGITILVIGIVLSSIFLSSGTSLDWGIVFPIGILALVNILLFKMELKTRIDQDSLSFSYFPFIKERKYRFEEIDSMDLIEYNGLLEYGGWGIKWNFDSWSYTTGGKHGILVKTKKKKFLLGTQKPAEAQKAIDQFNEFKSQSNGS